MPTTHHIRRRDWKSLAKPRDAYRAKEFADVPCIETTLAEKLRGSRTFGVLATKADEAEASRQIAAACAALKQRFAEASGGTWSERGADE